MPFFGLHLIVDIWMALLQRCQQSMCVRSFVASEIGKMGTSFISIHAVLNDAL